MAETSLAQSSVETPSGELVEGEPNNPPIDKLQLQINATTNGGTLSLALPGAQLPITEVDLSVPGISVSLPLPRLGTPLQLSADLPPGFALTSVVCPGASVDALGNLTFAVAPPATGILSCTFNTVDAVGESAAVTAPFLAQKSNLTLATELGLDHQIDSFFSDGGGEGEGNAPAGLGGPIADGAGPSATLTSDGASFSFSTSLRRSRALAQPYGLGASDRPGRSSRPPGAFNVWAEGYYYAFDQEAGGVDSDGHAGVLYIGADYLLSPNLLVGALVQLDDTEQDFSANSGGASDTGWMAGPYVMLRLSENLFFQTRAAWGRSENEIETASGLDDDFDSDRWLVKGTLLGRWQNGPWQFTPRGSVGYIEENQNAYTSSLGVDIPSLTVSLGQAKLGPEVSYRWRAEGGVVIQPSVLVEGIWNFEQSTGSLSIDDLITDDGVRARAEAGLAMTMPSGLALAASVSYDGIGSSELEAIGGKLRLRAPLN